MNDDEIQSLIRGAGLRWALSVDDRTAIETAARGARQGLVAAERERRRGRAFAGLALAASVALALVTGWWWLGRRLPAAPEIVATVELRSGEARLASLPAGDPIELAAGSRLPAGVELHTGEGTTESAPHLTLRWAGGQSVRLDRATSVRLVSGRRLELERGAIYLDSASAPGGVAIEIRTAYGTVRDIGTQFEVRLDEGVGDGVRVRVREGKVALEAPSGSHHAARGEELHLDRDGSLARDTISTHGPEWDWVLAAAPRPAIDGRSLRSFLDWVAREAGWELRYADAALERSTDSIRLHGSVEHLTAEEALAVVLAGSGLAYRLEGGTLVVGEAR